MIRRVDDVTICDVVYIKKTNNEAMYKTFGHKLYVCFLMMKSDDSGFFSVP